MGAQAGQLAAVMDNTKGSCPNEISLQRYAFRIKLIPKEIFPLLQSSPGKYTLKNGFLVNSACSHLTMYAVPNL